MAGIKVTKIDDIKNKVEKLAALATILSHDNQVLRNENIELKRELSDLRIRLKQSQTASGLTDALSKKRAKKWLNEILKEIDDCKRIINR